MARFAFRLERTYATARFLSRSPRVVLKGAVNAGKSTLFNAILGESRALTSRIPGTTRDPVEAVFLLHGFPIRLFDLPGDRDPENKGRPFGLEHAARAAAERCVADADLELFVLDASRSGPSDLPPAVQSMDSPLLGEGRTRIPVWNKTDLLREGGEERGETVSVSALRREGLHALLRRVYEVLGLSGLASSSGPLLFNRRQHALVRGARRAFHAGVGDPDLARRIRDYVGEPVFFS